jgi:hypothetical protein
MVQQNFDREKFKFLISTLLCTLWIVLGSSAIGAEKLAGRWEVRAPMPSARTEVAAAALDGKIYLIGGYEKHSGAVEEYDPAQNSWRRRTSLPKPLHHVGAAAIKGKIYVIGGYVSGVGSQDTVYEYDPAHDRWRLRSSMPTARGALAVGVIGDQIYAVGIGVDGKDTSASKPTILKPIAGPTCESRRCGHLAIGVVNGKLYAIAGRIKAATAKASRSMKNMIRQAIVGARARRSQPSEAVSPLPVSMARSSFSAVSLTVRLIMTLSLTIRSAIAGIVGRPCPPPATASVSP